MKRASAAALFVLIFAACGKVGPPKAPIHRMPQGIHDLNVTQSGVQVILAWTNPGQYIDNNGITDLAVVHVLRDGTEIAKEAAKPAGQPQSFPVDVTSSLETDMRFVVQVETQRGKTSTLSNEVRIRPVNVPGVPRDLRADFDERRMILDWAAPELNPNLVEAYVVSRSDKSVPVRVTTIHWEDAEVDPDKLYEYTVTAVRGAIPGAGAASIRKVATDTTSPAFPTGLQINDPGAGVFLKWNLNSERDFKQVLVYRSDQPEQPMATVPADGFSDSNYRPGLAYQLVAEDESGNRSQRTIPVAGP